MDFSVMKDENGLDFIRDIYFTRNTKIISQYVLRMIVVVAGGGVVSKNIFKPFSYNIKSFNVKPGSINDYQLIPTYHILLLTYIHLIVPHQLH
jgi:hypothetical protein